MTADPAVWRRAFRAQVPPHLQVLRGEALEDDLDARLHLELDERRSDKFAAGFHEACPFSGTTAEDYKQRVIETPSGLALVGIRVHFFERFPFVDIIATTHELTPASLPDLYDHAVETFASFDPNVLRILTPEPLEHPELVFELDQVVVAGPTLSAADSGPVSARPIEDFEEASSFLANHYQQYFREFPEMSRVIDPSTHDDLVECDRSGLAAWIEIDGARAGLIASCNDLGPLVGGQSMQEELLTSEYRGRGFGVRSQRAFLHELGKRVGPSPVWGTIDARNHPSRATAAGAGRPEISVWSWIRRP